MKKYIDWGISVISSSTISAELGSFIRQNDSRVKRIKGTKGFEYYCFKYERELNLSEVFENESSFKNRFLKNIKKEVYISF